jgi:Tfp pilus assembly protein PilE
MSQQNFLELAKQGDAEAIASLMNRQLQPKGITAKATINSSCLQVMLASEETPNQQLLVEFIRKGLTGLGITAIERVEIFGKKVGEDFPAWSQKLNLNGTQFELSVEGQKSNSNLKEQAKLGDNSAISMILGQTLQSKNVIVKTSLKEDTLNVMLESDDIPNEACATLIRREIVMLNSNLINKINIYAKQCGNDFPIWSKEIILSEINYSTQSKIHSSQSSSSNISLTINNKTIDLSNLELSKIAKISVIVGSVVLAIGVFCPIISAPVIGTLNYFHNGNGDGVILLMLAAISIFLAMKDEFKYIWWTGIASLAVTIIGFIGFQWKLSDIKSSMESELRGNPFRGLADAAVNSIQLQWGWIIILLGLGLIIAGAYLQEKENINKLGYINYLLDLINFRKSQKVYLFAGLMILGLIIPKAFAGVKAQVEYQTTVARAKQSEAKTYIGSMNRAQQAMFIEKEYFSSSIADLGLGMKSETSNYNYNILNADTSQAIATATAKENDLKSYTGVVFKVRKTGEDSDTTIIATCETNSSSKTPPTTPQLVGEDILCPAGSIRVDRTSDTTSTY